MFSFSECFNKRSAMRSLLLAVLVTVGLAQDTTLDPALLLNIFGTPPTPAKPGTGNLEDIIVKPTESNSVFTDKNGESCKCVPYYLCNKNNEGVDVNNASVTGWGVLDVRFGEEDCQESVEICCTNPITEPVPKPQPDPSKLKGCGYRNPMGVGVTITGGVGTEAQFGEFPWVVALLDALNESYAGVGVLIHPQVVMTGAHIAYKYTPGNLRARAGEWDTQTIKEMLDHQVRLVEEIIIHEDFNTKSLKNDVALLRMHAPFNLAEHINMICLPDPGDSFDTSKNCVANGWGKDVFGLQGRYAVILKKIEIDMVPNPRCNSLLQRTRLGTRFRLHDSFVCAGGQEGRDTCQGDGGAPLACPIGDSRYKLAGLVAWGIGCGQKDVPAVYANVARMRSWVDRKMNAWGYGTTTYTI